MLSQLLPSGSRPRAAVPGLPLPLVLQRGGCRASWLPPGWNSVAYFKLACTRSQQLQLRFFPHFICPRALRGGVEEGGAAPACSAASSSPAPAVVRLPAEMVMMLRAMSQLLTAACMERGGGFQIQLWASIRASILLSKSSTELRAQACQGRTVQQRGWGDPTRDQKLCAGEIPPSLTILPPPLPPSTTSSLSFSEWLQSPSSPTGFAGQRLLPGAKLTAVASTTFFPCHFLQTKLLMKAAYETTPPALGLR